MTLKEEREYKLIESGLTYLPDERRWTAKLPWIKDPYLLPNNKVSRYVFIEVNRKETIYKCKTKVII